jgi:hypothetical protein
MEVYKNEGNNSEILNINAKEYEIKLDYQKKVYGMKNILKN